MGDLTRFLKWQVELQPNADFYSLVRDVSFVFSCEKLLSKHVFKQLVMGNGVVVISLSTAF